MINFLLKDNMKIVLTDNYDRGFDPETLVSNISISNEAAESIVEYLNRRRSDREWFKVVDDDYVLDPGFQP